MVTSPILNPQSILLIESHLLDMDRKHHAVARRVNSLHDLETWVFLGSRHNSRWFGVRTGEPGGLERGLPQPAVANLGLI